MMKRMIPPLISIRITQIRITSKKIEVRGAADAASGITLVGRRSINEGNSRFAVRVFKPPVARSQE